MPLWGKWFQHQISPIVVSFSAHLAPYTSRACVINIQQIEEITQILSLLADSDLEKRDRTVSSYSNKKLLETSATLVVTGALLVVTRSAKTQRVDQDPSDGSSDGSQRSDTKRRHREAQCSGVA